MVHPLRAYPRLQKVESIIDDRQKAHLGCGDIILESWHNVDLFSDHPMVRKWDLKEIPCQDEFFHIAYSCHALEHVSRDQGIECLDEWYRILVKGGTLFLSVPDIEGICRRFSDQPDWFLNCIYGLQSHAGHFHKWGYTEKSLKMKLMAVGFEIKFSEKMEYGNTPSLWMEAQK